MQAVESNTFSLQLRQLDPVGITGWYTKGVRVDVHVVIDSHSLLPSLDYYLLVLLHLFIFPLTHTWMPSATLQHSNRVFHSATIIRHIRPQVHAAAGPSCTAFLPQLLH